MEVFVQIVVLYSLLEGAGYLHLQGWNVEVTELARV
jgi:hypothetical protein